MPRMTLVPFWFFTELPGSWNPGYVRGEWCCRAPEVRRTERLYHLTQPLPASDSFFTVLVGEAGWSLGRRVFLEGSEECRRVFPGWHDQEGVTEQPVVAGVRRDVGLFDRIGAQVEHLRQAQLGEGLGPDAQGGGETQTQAPRHAAQVSGPGSRVSDSAHLNALPH